MRFIVVVATVTGMCRFNCTSIDDVLETFCDVLRERPESIESIVAWCRGARLGDWYDWPGGYVFTVARDPTLVDPSSLIGLGDDVEEDDTNPRMRLKH